MLLTAKIIIQTALCEHGDSHTQGPGSEKAAHLSRQEQNMTPS